jgi:hypothetical protein
MSLLGSFKRRFGRSKVSIRMTQSYPDIVETEFHAAPMISKMRSIIPSSPVCETMFRL